MRRQWRLVVAAAVILAVSGPVLWTIRGRNKEKVGRAPAAVGRLISDGKVVQRKRFVASTASVPILMYHVIASPPSGAPYPGLYVRPDEFDAQMKALRAAGYQAVTLDEVRAAWMGRGALPRLPIVISFDNGYRTQYTQALPILRRLGWIGDENLQLTGLPPSQGGLSTREVRALIRSGWELDTQGNSHADLIALNTAQLQFQIGGTRRVLRRRYHVPVNWFCYPSGHYDGEVVAEVQHAGFVGSTTVMPGWARPSDDRYRLPRLRVLGGTSARALLSFVAGERDAPPPPDAYGAAP